MGVQRDRRNAMQSKNQGLLSYDTKVRSSKQSRLAQHDPGPTGTLGSFSTTASLLLIVNVPSVPGFSVKRFASPISREISLGAASFPSVCAEVTPCIPSNSHPAPSRHPTIRTEPPEYVRSKLTIRRTYPLRMCSSTYADKCERPSDEQLS